MTKKRETKQERLTHPFIVDAIERQDLIGLGYDKDEVLDISDDNMNNLAFIIGESLANDDVWADVVEGVLKNYGIRKSDE